MLITVKGQRSAAAVLVILPYVLATEQTTQPTQAEATPRSNHGGLITGGSQCEARTINYITHSLPQFCLTSSWASATSTVIVEGAPLVTATESTTFRDDEVLATAEPPIAESSPTGGVDEIEIESTAEPFMSFEDWKEMMLQKSGQDLQDLRRKGSEAPGEDRPKHAPEGSNAALGEEEETQLKSDAHTEKPDAHITADDATRSDEQVHELSDLGQPTLHRNKDAGKTCKERFSFASFDAGATILKTSSGAKNSKAILVENKDTYMLLECATPNKYVIIELTDDIWVDTIVLANFEFFSSMIRHFRVSVSDRYPVKIEKWKELGTFEARNSRDIQAFLVENPQIWAKYLRLEFLTHYSNEYYCPVSLVRVHGSRMLDKWKDSETGADDDAFGEIGGFATEETITVSEQEQDSPEVPHFKAGIDDVYTSPRVDILSIQLPTDVCPAADMGITVDDPPTASQNTKSVSDESAEKTTAEVGDLQSTSTTTEKMNENATVPVTAEVSKSQASPNTAAEDDQSDASIKSRNTKSSSTETASSSPPAPAGKSQSATVQNNKARGNGTAAATPSIPTMQEGFFNSVTKRLQQVETNLTLSLKYVEEQSKHVQDAFQRAEQKQLSKISSVLTDLNQTVLEELRNFRDQYDQIWQSTVLALESQKDQSERDILALSARLHVLADEVVFQKRMAIVQAVLLLSCLLLVIFSRGVPIPYLGSPSDQGIGTSAAFAEILASMQRRDMYPGGSPRYTLDARTPTTPDAPASGSPPLRQLPIPQADMDEYNYQRPSPPLTPNHGSVSPIPEWQTSNRPSAMKATGYDLENRHLNSRKPLPVLPEDPSSPG